MNSASSKFTTGFTLIEVVLSIAIITLIFVYRLGGVIGIYWLFSTLFSVGEQYLVNRKIYGQKNQK